MTATETLTDLADDLRLAVIAGERTRQERAVGMDVPDADPVQVRDWLLTHLLEVVHVDRVRAAELGVDVVQIAAEWAGADKNLTTLLRDHRAVFALRGDLPTIVDALTDRFEAHS